MGRSRKPKVTALLCVATIDCAISFSASAGVSAMRQRRTWDANLLFMVIVFFVSVRFLGAALPFGDAIVGEEGGDEGGLGDGEGFAAVPFIIKG